MATNFKEEMRQKMKEAEMLRAVIQNECDHKVGKRDTVEPLNRHQQEGMITGNAQGWSASAIRCTECGTIFESKTYSKVQTQDGIRMFHSMANQFKFMVDLPESDQKMIMEVQAAVHTLDKFQIAYAKMLKELGNNKGGNNNNNRRNNGGGFGISSSQFRGRNY